MRQLPKSCGASPLAWRPSRPEPGVECVGREPGDAGRGGRFVPRCLSGSLHHPLPVAATSGPANRSKAFPAGGPCSRPAKIGSLRQLAHGDSAPRSCGAPARPGAGRYGQEETVNAGYIAVPGGDVISSVCPGQVSHLVLGKLLQIPTLQYDFLEGRWPTDRAGCFAPGVSRDPAGCRFALAVRCRLIQTVPGPDSIAKRAAPSMPTRSSRITFTGMASSRVRIRPLARKAFMKSGSSSLSAIFGAMPPPR